MPAWITSLLRDEVTVPMPSAASSTITSRPACASRRAISKTDHPRTDDDAINFVHVAASDPGSCSIRPDARQALARSGSIHPTLSLCLGWSVSQNRLDPFRAFQAGSPLVKH